jgi:hypothetical protein
MRGIDFALVLCLAGVGWASCPPASGSPDGGGGLALAAPAKSSAPAPSPADRPPSPNKGRTGAYECKTSKDGYNYWVCVPKAYSEDNPAGLHLFFHGQGGGASASHFDLWARHFLEPHNLIGINMQYADGDNAKDTAGKVEAAIEAIRQTAADYKIIVGRGACGSFSGGGLTHERLFEKFGRYAAGRPGPCLFNHAALYDSNYFGDPTSVPPMSWFISLGGKEWGMGQPTLGTSQPKRAEQCFNAALKGGCPDAYLKIIKDKGHDILDVDVRDSAAQFRRSDLAFAPFLYERDYPEPQVAVIVRLANALALGRAAASADRILADAKADEKVKAKAKAVKTRIEARIDAVLTLAKELADADAALTAYYGNIFTNQLGPHPKAKDLRDMLAAARKQPTYQPGLTADANFWTNFRNVFQGSSLAPGAAKFLEDTKAKAGEKSLVGKMAAEFLLMQGP